MPNNAFKQRKRFFSHCVTVAYRPTLLPPTIIREKPAPLPLASPPSPSNTSTPAPSSISRLFSPVPSHSPQTASAVSNHNKSTICKKLLCPPSGRVPSSLTGLMSLLLLPPTPLVPTPYRRCNSRGVSKLVRLPHTSRHRCLLLPSHPFCRYVMIPVHLQRRIHVH